MESYRTEKFKVFVTKYELSNKVKVSMEGLIDGDKTRSLCCYFSEYMKISSSDLFVDLSNIREIKKEFVVCFLKSLERYKSCVKFSFPA